MKRYGSFIAVIAMTIMLSCKSADNNAANIATDFCDCLKSLERNLGEDTKRIINNAVNASDPTKSVQDDVIALGEEKGKQVGEEMQAVGDMDDENTEVGACLKKVEKKYSNAYTMNEKKTMNKIIKELEKKPGCNLTASLMKLGLKMEGKIGDD